EGYYSYPAQSPAPAAAAHAPVVADASRPPTCNIWVSSAIPEAAAAVSKLVGELGGKLETGTTPSAEALCLVTPIGREASQAAAAEGLDPYRTVAIDVLFGLEKHRTLMATCVTGKEWQDAACALFGSDGVPGTMIRDSPGFIAQRIVAMIINIGGALAQSRTASPTDIDRAVTLGLAYPHGPLAFANA